MCGYQIQPRHIGPFSNPLPEFLTLLFGTLCFLSIFGMIVYSWSFAQEIYAKDFKYTCYINEITNNCPEGIFVNVNITKINLKNIKVLLPYDNEICSKNYDKYNFLKEFKCFYYDDELHDEYEVYLGSGYMFIIFSIITSTSCIFCILCGILSKFECVGE